MVRYVITTGKGKPVGRVYRTKMAARKAIRKYLGRGLNPRIRKLV